MQLRIFFTLYIYLIKANHHDKWSFNTKDVDILRSLAAHVPILSERQKQDEKVNCEDWDDGDIAKMEQLISISMVSVQNMLHWTPMTWDPNVVIDSE